MMARIMRKIKQFLGIREDRSLLLTETLRAQGCRIGQRTFFFDPDSIHVDVSRPWLIEIGDDVQITAGCRILTHGYDWSVLKGCYGDVLGSAGKVTIGNNVFIGTNTVILKGTSIGNNVIIGAGSLVNSQIPDNCVAVGNPCRPIMSLEEYYQKRLSAQEAEAAELVREYRAVYGMEPPKEALAEFFWLFSDGENQLDDSWKAKMELVGNSAASYEKLKTNCKKYDSFEAFLASVK